jgi:hypothetical protein
MTIPVSTTHAEPCPGCDQADGSCWVTSTPDTDTGPAALRHRVDHHRPHHRDAAMSRRPGDSPDPYDRRYSPWNADRQACEAWQPDRTEPRYPDVVTYIPGLDHRPGRPN